VPNTGDGAQCTSPRTMGTHGKGPNRKVILKQKKTSSLRAVDGPEVIKALLRLLDPTQGAGPDLPEESADSTLSVLSPSKYGYGSEPPCPEVEGTGGQSSEHGVTEELALTVFYSDNDSKSKESDSDDLDNEDNHESQMEKDEELESDDSSGDQQSTSTPRKAASLRRFARLSPAQHMRDTPSVLARRTTRSRGIRGTRAVTGVASRTRAHAPSITAPAITAPSITAPSITATGSPPNQTSDTRANKGPSQGEPVLEALWFKL
jgi:hypothetical protein